MSDIKKVTATWSIDLSIICPYCNHLMDGMELDEWWDVFKEPGTTIRDLNFEVDCFKCDKKFIVNNTEY